MNDLFEKIRNDAFNSSNIHFAPPIGRVEKSTMKKRFPDCPLVFLRVLLNEFGNKGHLLYF
ncbi:hypothetical protein, partial [Paenibacillus riograndensis]